MGKWLFAGLQIKYDWTCFKREINVFEMRAFQKYSFKDISHLFCLSAVKYFEYVELVHE